VSTIEKAKDTISEIANEHDYSYLLFDNHESAINFRKRIYPGYKSRREHTLKHKLNNDTSFADRFYGAIDLFGEYMLSLRDDIYCARSTGYEADDLVDPIVKTILDEQPNSSIQLFSADLDWARSLSLSDKVVWSNFKEVVNRRRFEEIYGYPPIDNRVQLYKSIRGDSSDSIPVGIPRITSDETRYLVNKYTSVPDMYAGIKYDETVSKELKARINKHESKVRLNNALVTAFPPRVSEISISEGKRNEATIESIEVSLGIRDMVAEETVTVDNLLC
jgi:5'-3' exonuclease